MSDTSQTRRKRIMSDYQALRRNGYEFQPNAMTGVVVKFPGPADSPYEGAVFEVEITYPDNYPFYRPTVKFLPGKVPFHPNINYTSGSICLDILSSRWRPVFDVLNVVESFLPQLLIYPNPDDPLYSEAARSYRCGDESYRNAVRTRLERDGLLDDSYRLHVPGEPAIVALSPGLVPTVRTDQMEDADLDADFDDPAEEIDYYTDERLDALRATVEAEFDIYHDQQLSWLSEALRMEEQPNYVRDHLEFADDDENVDLSVYDAAISGDMSMLSFLAQLLPNIDDPDDSGITALQYAALNGHTAAVQQLLELNASLTILDPQGRNALDFSIEEDQLSVAKALLQAGATPNLHNRHGWSNLMISLLYDPDIALEIIASGNLDVSSHTESERYTALHVAAACSTREVVESLLGAGFNPNCRSEFDRTPLHLAALHNNTAVVLPLVNAGASHTVQDAAGLTPLLLAIPLRHTSVIREFLSYGASSEPQGAENIDPIKLAQEAEISHMFE